MSEVAQPGEILVKDSQGLVLEGSNPPAYRSLEAVGIKFRIIEGDGEELFTLSDCPGKYIVSRNQTGEIVATTERFLLDLPEGSRIEILSIVKWASLLPSIQ